MEIQTQKINAVQRIVRAADVIQSCRTVDQVQVAYTYARLAARGLPVSALIYLYRLAGRRMVDVIGQ